MTKTILIRLIRNWRSPIILWVVKCFTVVHCTKPLSFQKLHNLYDTINWSKTTRPLTNTIMVKKINNRLLPKKHLIYHLFYNRYAIVNHCAIQHSHNIFKRVCSCLNQRQTTIVYRCLILGSDGISILNSIWGFQTMGKNCCLLCFLM